MPISTHIPLFKEKLKKLASDIKELKKDKRNKDQIKRLLKEAKALKKTLKVCGDEIPETCTIRFSLDDIENSISYPKMLDNFTLGITQTGWVTISFRLPDFDKEVDKE